ncbi:hypothetical protein BDN70DRAFT_877383 [Pholiota conissans]|uniref:Uncharacterized protein n=1 Tax=Pholiota conissans TaxID=109636 RepID=A0A9P5Z5Y2_9AGAR|nr:hypothetical protein BDN70DRAFT_877383 [Pholiota conissans]
MWALKARQAFKQTLSVTKISILYARITLTRFTTLYFFFAIITCIILSGLQGVTFTDNANAISALSGIVGNIANDEGIVVLEKNTLQYCDSIPHQAGTICIKIMVFGSPVVETRSMQEDTPDRRDDGEDLDNEDMGDDNSDDEENDDDKDEVLVGPVVSDSPSQSNQPSTSNNGGGVVSSSSTPSTPSSDLSEPLGESCILSLRWLDEMIHDAQREDIVTFVFQLWLFVLALVTILNESIPHLIAAVFGHILGTAWSGYRVYSVKHLKSLYRDHIVPEACGNRDMLGNWWDVRISHAIPVVVMNCVALVSLCLLSVKLYRVYTTESFSRVGASAKIHRMYKIVLLFSVFLQLSGFFSVASAGMWIDKVCHGAVMELAKHSKLYLAAFIVILIVTFPWFYLGWVCVRKECNIRFGIFVAISVILLVISTLMFESPLYRYIFVSWPLFATMTITAYVLTVVTTALAIFCHLNFGKGLGHYFQVTDALEGMDFTPVVFTKDQDRDLEKYDITDHKLASLDATSAPMTVHLPVAAFTLPGQHKKAPRGPSVYSDQGSAVYLSSTPPLISELAPAPNRLSRAASTRSSLAVPAYPRLTALPTQMDEREKKRRSAASAKAKAKARDLVVSVGPVRQEGVLPVAAPIVAATAAAGSDLMRSVSAVSTFSAASVSSTGVPRPKKQGLPSNPRVGSGRTSPPSS